VPVAKNAHYAGRSSKRLKLGVYKYKNRLSEKQKGIHNESLFVLHLEN
jgi:hypothetical protein